MIIDGARLNWVKLPTDWINRGELKTLRQKHPAIGDRCAIAMVLIALAHHRDRHNDISEMSYTELEMVTDLSRAKIYIGLQALKEFGLISLTNTTGRGRYHLIGFENDGRWGKLPCRSLYNGGRYITFFRNFSKRKAAEADALFLYMLFVARRNDATNLVDIGYERIATYTGMGSSTIRAAKSVLVNAGLLNTEARRNDANGSMHFAYRLIGIDGMNNLATGKSLAKEILNL